MQTDTCYCRNVECLCYGVAGQGAQLKFHDWHNGRQRFRCVQCGHLVSARVGTACAGIRTPESIYESGARHLAEGTSIRATGRLLNVDKDTVGHWLPRLGAHCNRVMSYFFRDLHLSECQLDELWTFIYKKEDQLTPLDELLGIYGDAWVWIAFSPVCKLVPAWVVGKRTLANARKLVFRLKSATDGHIPFFTSGELPHLPMRCWRRMGSGIPHHVKELAGEIPCLVGPPPPDLCYAVVVKERENGRVVNVTTRVV